MTWLIKPYNYHCFIKEGPNEICYESGCLRLCPVVGPCPPYCFTQWGVNWDL